MVAPDKSNQILLVEGNDDKHVILALCKQNHIDETFEVIDCDGVDNLIEQIGVRFKTSGIKTVGLIADADESLLRRWESIKNVLIGIGFVIPDNIPDNGLIAEHAGKKAGVWIMPDNRVNGMLEDFISFLIPEEDALLPIVHSTLENIESGGLNRYSLNHHAKASIHTWLAWQSDPGTPLGLSITKRYLTTDVETCNKLLNWLRRLFN